MPTVGIVRGLHAYHHFSEWRAFLAALGLDVVLGPATTRHHVDTGVRMAPAELCLPFKSYIGQIAELAPLVDRLLLPRIVCQRRGRDHYFGCPKAIALPDVTRAILPEFVNGVELVLDDRCQTRAAAFRSLAGRLGCRRRWRDAYYAAAATEQTTRARTNITGSPLHMFGVTSTLGKEPDETRPRVGLIGHPYLLFDDTLSLAIRTKVRSAGAEPVVMTNEFDLPGGRARENGYLNWLYEVDLIVAARKFIEMGSVRGLLLVSSFACGTAAVVNEIIRREVVAGSQLPILTLLLDEHSGDAGVMTRVESFVDLLRTRGNM